MPIDLVRRALDHRSGDLWSDETPIRAELFSVERLEAHAKSLALAQPVDGRPKAGRSLTGRLLDNQRRLIEAFVVLQRSGGGDDGATPAAQWLLDNFHVVEEQIREIRRDLPPGYYRQLPKLISGPFAGYPRVFGLVWAFVAHTDSRFDVDMLQRYVHAYQSVHPLTIGELWAVAITLRLILVENLRRLADQILDSREARITADQLADRLLGAYGRDPEPAAAVLRGWEGRRRFTDAFTMQLVHRLRDQDASIAPVLSWVDEQLAGQSVTADAVVRGEHDRQVAAAGTVRNIVTSLRRISEVDWLDLVERMSLVDAALTRAGDFGEMNFATRNLYRTAIEALSRGSGKSEMEVTRAAIARAGACPGEVASCHVGCHLIGSERRRFERALGFRPPRRELLTRTFQRLGAGGYAAGIISAAAVILLAPLLYLRAAGLDGVWLAALAVLGVVPALELAVALVNAVITHSIRASFLPALELAGGIPSEHRTLVAVPMMLTSPAAIQEQVAGLEIHYLASVEGDVHFALLSDWIDADRDSEPVDGHLLTLAAEGVAALNRKYGPAPGGDRFLLLHRRRVWNDSERHWIGWERKRGKLQELNRLLRGAQDTTFVAPPGGQISVPAGVRYVITLDADTRLPHDTVRRLIGKMAHPLNRPRLDTRKQRVVEGYGILQPRITPALPVGHRGSLFHRLFSGASGIDPYAAAVSDVYQDLFGEGSYGGKGIYDVDAFEAALSGRVPESTLLSHDLFEGVYARAGLASDVEVVDDAPTRYDVASLRHHRWARGDWQLLPWILRIPAGRCAAPGPLPVIGRLKMLDNLRRTLTAPAAVAALFAGWATLGGHAVVWTLFVLGSVVAPALMPLIDDLAPRAAGIRTRDRLRGMGADLRVAAARALLLVTLLPHQAWLMSDAIVRTLWRLFVSRRRLLEWVPAAQLAAGLRLEVSDFYRRMWSVLPLALAGLAISATWSGKAWPVGVSISLAWLFAPLVAQRVSRIQPLPEAGELTPADTAALRLTARRTWRYFEAYVTAGDNHLPPDNVQEDPPAVAHRTSPTNIGLYLLSTACARDLGWIGVGEALERIEATLATLQRMERRRGHFLNWYDTRDLRALEPLYVSTVDSGNLAGCLLTLAASCHVWRDHPLPPLARWAGVSDAIGLAREELAPLCAPAVPAHQTWRRLDEALRDFCGTFGGGEEGKHARSAFDDVLREWAGLAEPLRGLLAEREDAAELAYWLSAVEAGLRSHLRDLEFSELDRRLAAAEAVARQMALEMEYGFLLDPDRKLLSIGYRVADGTLDANCYDLLASEARLASFLAIAKGDVPARHWFRLGHAVTPTPEGAALISWSGSMFEYLMPSLVMRSPAGSLLERSLRAVVRRQIAYGRSHGRPWGVSESGFNARDLEFTYQYSNFGIPGLGLKRGLGEEAVVAPYATALAAMIDPREAVANFEVLAAAGAKGRHGFYEALDYTPARVPEGTRVAIVRSFMAHHQGMTVTALANTLLGGLLRERFHADPLVQAAELLLHERMPRDVRPATAAAEREGSRLTEAPEPVLGRRYSTPHGASPATHILSNGRYSVLLTAAGGGYSRWRSQALTRWREDSVRDDWGAFIYLRDVASGRVWSTGYQPTAAEPSEYGVTFFADRAEYSRRDGDLATELVVLVSAEDDGELRRVTLTNAGDVEREVEITSYGELVLAPDAADAAHPAFSKLFVETEHHPALGGALLATRRRRAPEEPELWAAHLAIVEGEALGKPEFETDRARFLGRNRDVRAPIAVFEGRPLTGEAGAVLDPIFALRRRVRIAAGSTAQVSFWTFAAGSREAILEVLDQHLHTAACERAAALAWTRAQVQLRHLGVTHRDADNFQRLAGHLIYAAPALRPPSEVVAAGAGGQPDLWALGISGDLPLILLRIDDLEHLATARDLLHAAEYWKLQRLPVDVVILNDHAASYIQDLQGALEALVRVTQSRRAPDEEPLPGGVYVLRGDLISPALQARLLSVARVVLSAQHGRLEGQLDRLRDQREWPRPPLAAPQVPARPLRSSPVPDLEAYNGIGGFAREGREYVVVLSPGQTTPAPWINVVANPSFGFQISAEGSGYTWALNSREHQLTPWSNDPVADRGGEALYLRDMETGELWSPTAYPVRDPEATYVCRHGRGYSRFEATVGDFETELLAYTPLLDPVKILRLKVRNLSNRPRRLSACAYVEWVLGKSRDAIAPFTVTHVDEASGALMAQNRWDPSFGERVAFLDACGRQTNWTGDRREFIGRNGSLRRPAGLAGGALSGRTGAALDPCGAMDAPLSLAPGETGELVFLIGEGEDADAARELIARYGQADLDDVLAEVDAYWERLLGTVQVQTPDPALDLMLNGWLLYQTVASRLWARAGFYQASGAYGFRDQLQDVMALVHAAPETAREHLLRAAARQFPEGDVQHWWLPHSGQGVRTRFSDDRVWLAYAVANYVVATGDRAVLDEPIPFLEGEALEPTAAEAFFRPGTGESASLFEHCARALDASLQVGGHGAPLIGGGDWNDGMNRVGQHGRGESVWLGWFLQRTLTEFAPLAAALGQAAHAGRWAAHAEGLKAALERSAWGGDWYLRGWYDDGSPLGSPDSDECRIDAIAQSWAVLSGAAEPNRARQALAAVERELIDADAGLALLFTPPFDKGPKDPGYIKGYPVGVRENGGQYTHAAVWTAMAFAAVGDGDRTASLLAMLNPINHSRTPSEAQRYKVEPYVVAADIYSHPAHLGRGGWTWYTGAAGWMYRAGLESLLGLRRHGDALLLDPCIPRHWPGFKLVYRFGAARYEIEVENRDGVCRGVAEAVLDGVRLRERPLRIPLSSADGVRRLRVRLGAVDPKAGAA
ncbi:MAG: glucoamylase family protein [Phenylobacterium sp.]|uniref:GH36-type glycosyl hydrolase domain-containing protein n=1 Tax=Phenylobacterium sp. TaxID=1871053 RepID=UPI00271A9ED6|nr:glucoamylase family protein [Phenylobacterium sp.]MDO8410927.1 glucoamylase family protein [Phenylobacterium sp.]